MPDDAPHARGDDATADAEAPDEPRHVGRTVVVGGLFLIVIVGALSTWALWPRDATTVTDRQAIETYRQTTTTTLADTTVRADIPDAVPSAGVYRYTATGTETSKFGPLPEKTNPLPDTVTGTVAPPAKGCFTFTLALFAQHTEDTKFCVDGSTLTMPRYAKHQTVGTLTATATVTCDPGTFISTAKTDNDLACTMTLEGGPFTTTAEFSGTAHRSAPETMTVDGRNVAVTPVTVTFTFTGKVTGTWIEQTWFDANHLPVRIKRTLHMKGPASFDETFDLHIQSLTPST